MRTVRYCADNFEAQVIKGRLESEAIPAFVINENATSVVPYATAIPSLAPQVVVDEADFDAATAILQSDATIYPHAEQLTCPECGSTDVEYGFMKGKSLLRRVVLLIFLPLVVLLGNTPGNVRSSYHCRNCRREFK